MSKVLFEKRHYEWLASFAAKVLNNIQVNILIADLYATNPNFKVKRFIKRVEQLRNK